jgi:hypothetical protein
MAVRKKKIPEVELITSNMDDIVYSHVEHRVIPINFVTILKLIDKLNTFVKQDHVLRMSQFLNKEEIIDQDWYRWVDKYPELKTAHEGALRIIAERREVGAITGKYKESAVMPYMSMYDKSFKEHAEWRASLAKKNEEETSAIKFVLMKDMPETDMVPKKKVIE